MKHRIATFLSVAAVLGASSMLLADKPAKPRPADRAKKVVEAVPEALVLKAERAKAKQPQVDITKEKIEAARQAWAEGDWEAGRFQLPPGDTDEFIPLPDNT